MYFSVEIDKSGVTISFSTNRLEALNKIDRYRNEVNVKEGRKVDSILSQLVAIAKIE